MSEDHECSRAVENHEDRADPPTINIEASHEESTNHSVNNAEMNRVVSSDRKLRSESDPQFQERTEHDLESGPRSWADSMSDISQCSSSNRPVSLCVKYAESEDNLLAIESDLEALDAESNYEKLQRQFDNSKLSDIFDYEQEQSLRTEEEVDVCNPDEEESPRVC